MPLPQTASATKDEFVRRLQSVEAFADDILSSPSWAKDAFRRATESMQWAKPMLESEGKSPAYASGVLTSLMTDSLMPAAEETSADLIRNNQVEPANKLRAAINLAMQFDSEIEGDSEKAALKYLPHAGEDRDQFIEGMNRWQRLKPDDGYDLRPSSGGSATTTFLYLAVFWREFEELRSLKEAYFGLFCMFDKKPYLVGSYDTFRKRAEVIDLTLPKKPASR